MTGQRRHRSQRPPVSLSILSCLVIAALWILFVGGTRADEMYVGFFVLLLSAAFLFRIYDIESLRLDLRMTDLVTCWRIPWYILSDGYAIVLVLLRDLTGHKAGSFYRFCGFKTDGHDPRSLARRVLATAYTTATPNSIVIGIDVGQSRMLFHQLKRSEVSLMAKALGAQPGLERP